MRSPAIILSEGRFFVEGRFELCSVKIAGGVIAEVSSSLRPNDGDIVVPLEGTTVIPGLINSHDHLEFNLFSRIGNPPYKNYVEWGEDIHRNHEEYIRQVLKVPLKIRLLWGAYKNILSGVTTVIHHNTLYPYLRFGFPVDVFRNYTWVHSLELDGNLNKKLAVVNKKPWIIHLAEGVDELAGKEVRSLKELGGLTGRTVIVHGINLSDRDIADIAKAGASLVWCPGSNDYLFRATTPVEKLRPRIRVVLGSDSTLTGNSSMFDEIRLAGRLKHVPASALLEMTTSAPADVFGMNKGRIAVGARADLLMFNSNGSDPMSGFMNLAASDIKCLLREGVPIYGDGRMVRMFRNRKRQYSSILVSESEKVVVGDIPALIAAVRRFLPSYSFNLLRQRIAA